MIARGCYAKTCIEWLDTMKRQRLIALSDQTTPLFRAATTASSACSTRCDMPTELPVLTSASKPRADAHSSSSFLSACVFACSSESVCINIGVCCACLGWVQARVCYLVHQIVHDCDSVICRFLWYAARVRCVTLHGRLVYAYASQQHTTCACR